MSIFLLLLHLVISVCLIALILLQSSKGGLGRALGGDVIYRSKRGAEKIIFTLTFIFAILFFVTSVANYFVR